MKTDYDANKKEVQRRNKRALEEQAQLPVVCCGRCSHRDQHNPVDGMLPGNVEIIRRYWCIRYPTNILKRLTDHCGEFAKET